MRPLVLIVEDDRDIAEMYALVLGQAGYATAIANDGAAGLEKARTVAPNIILLDMMMPGMDGLSFLQRLPEGHPPVLASSAFDAFEQPSLDQGAWAFLRKPIGARELVAAVGVALAGHPLAPQALARHAEQVQRGLDDAADARRQLLHRVDFAAPKIRRDLEGATQWLTAYFGVAAAMVNVLRDHDIQVEASFGGGRQFATGTQLDRKLTFCADVVDARSALVLGDTSIHPSFAEHPAARLGFRFYAGAPLVTSRGTALGALCLVDLTPRDFHGEDMMILEYFASDLGRHIEELSGGAGRGLAFAFERPGLLTGEALLVIAGAELLRATRTGQPVELAAVEFQPDGDALWARCAQAVASLENPERFAVGASSGTRLGLLRGAGPQDRVRAAMEDGLAAARKCGTICGIGRISYSLQGLAPIGAPQLERLAVQALLHSLAHEGVSHRVILSGERVEDRTA